MIEKPRHHEPMIDWLRAIASLAVVIFHINEVRSSNDFYGSVVSYGWLGVPIFFVVSGYCVTLSSLSRPPPMAFLIKRYARVLPPYWASLAVVAAVVVARKLISGSNDVSALPKNAYGVLATLTLTTSPVSSIPTINWVYWTLSYELAFYGVMALSLVKKSVFPWAMILVTVLSLSTVQWPLAYVPGLFFLDHWPLFAIGVALAETIHRGSLFGKTLLLIAVTGLFVLNHPPVIIAAGATVLSICLARWMPEFEFTIRSRAARFLGEISFSLYLVHVPIGIYVLGHVFGLAKSDSLITKLMADFVIVLGCIAASYLFNVAVERPAQRMARRFGKRRGLAHIKS